MTLRFLILCCCILFSGIAGFTWFSVSYGQLPAEAPVPLSYGLILMLIMLPGFFAIFYIGYLMDFAKLTSDLFPALAPADEKFERYMRKRFPRIAANLFWKQDEKKYRSAEEARRTMQKSIKAEDK